MPHRCSAWSISESLMRRSRSRRKLSRTCATITTCGSSAPNCNGPPNWISGRVGLRCACEGMKGCCCPWFDSGHNGRQTWHELLVDRPHTRHESGPEPATSHLPGGVRGHPSTQRHIRCEFEHRVSQGPRVAGRKENPRALVVKDLGGTAHVRGCNR